MSVQQIADHTTRLHHPLSRDVITNYELGRKKSI